jgi:hypothetical protein
METNKYGLRRLEIPKLTPIIQYIGRTKRETPATMEYKNCTDCNRTLVLIPPCAKIGISKASMRASKNNLAHAEKRESQLLEE